MLLELEGWPQAANRRGTAWPETVALAVLMPSQKTKRHDLKRGHDNCKSPQTTVEKQLHQQQNNNLQTCLQCHLGIAFSLGNGDKIVSTQFGVTICL